MANERFLTARDIAERLKVSRAYAYELIRSLPHDAPDASSREAIRVFAAELAERLVALALEALRPTRTIGGGL